MNSSVPFFSVITPVHNKAPHVARAIRSVLAQTWDNFELLLVDDASSDDSLQEMQAFSDERLRIFQRDTPGPGGYAARNLAISRARAQWIAFLDADDEWMPDHLETMHAMITAHPDVPVFTSARMWEKGGVRRLDSFSATMTARTRMISFLEYLRFSSRDRNPIDTNSIVVRRNLLPRTDWFPQGRTPRSGDLYLWVVLLARAGRALWSARVGSVSYRDIIGVSRSCAPSLTLSHEMVRELAPDLSRRELAMLRRYANRLVSRAWFEGRAHGQKPARPLPRELYWLAGNPGFCLKWTVLSFVPLAWFNGLARVKRSFRG
ncbi:hypothetical protein AU468_12390 [Alkalispirochaeta sphaeroplastigenens]|uniref:Glycosyltransferase 2-like domain-containing protein n=2 Tax=Alkalispirochaeta TaxID=2024958 RepID=A0A2S4JGL1_9SPIO|nr:glycosyltransferase family 2 protein [Alkalispirochaeta sphaeroplastigenens]POQ98656.1 hypothetical protein AU468_12390 [Alkalispirochaeta sphaeroplastigenens]